MDQLVALTSLDGRYRRVTEGLRENFSEYGLMKNRIFVEAHWFVFLSSELKLFKLADKDKESVLNIINDFTVQEASKVKEIEATTNHDVKAIEYYLKNKLDDLGLGVLKEWIHFACTSADINNTSYALMMKQGKQIVLDQLSELHDSLAERASSYKSIALMSRTHGQPATPTTMGKEFANFAWRINRETQVLNNLEIEAKLNGATGNFNAHRAAFPKIDWISASQKFITKSLELKPLLLTTQINPMHYVSEILHCYIRIASTMIDIDRDLWGYISFGYFKQKLKEGEVGSSTMPHKVNPIDFENSEGNLGLGISLMEHLSVKLLNSRYQRDLTDSTVMRNLGSVFGYLMLGFASTLKGMGKLEINELKISEDLDNNWELLAEPIQTIMRVYGEDEPYEKLKSLTRGQKINEERLAQFIDTLEKVPEDVKNRMKTMTPANYIGFAEELVDLYLK